MAEEKQPETEEEQGPALPQALYDWLDREPELFHPGDVDYIHDPARIGGLKNVISINGGV